MSSDHLPTSSEQSEKVNNEWSLGLIQLSLFKELTNRLLHLRAHPHLPNFLIALLQIKPTGKNHLVENPLEGVLHIYNLKKFSLQFF